MNDYVVYILRCSDDSFYCGITNNIENRLIKHNNGTASKYTRGRRPVELVYLEKDHDKSSALKREIEIKKLTRIQKEKLIEKYR